MSDIEIAAIKEQIKTLFNDVIELKNDMKELKEQFANRLPLWATMLIGFLTAACGWLIGKH